MDIKINKGSILTLAASADVFVRGEKLAKNGCVSDIFFTQSEQTESVRAVVTAENEAARSPQLLFSNRGDVLRYHCTCGESTVWRGACKHTVALMLSLLDQKSEDMQNRMNLRVTKSVNDAFELLLREEMKREFPPLLTLGEKAVLLPILYCGSDVRIKFKIGITHFYVIKNIKDFLRYVKNGTGVQYGKNFVFTHTMEAFDDRSQALIKMLQAYYDVLAALQHNTHHAAPNREPETFKPSGTYWDRFFELYEGQVVSVEDWREQRMRYAWVAQSYRINAGAPQIRFKITFSDGAAEIFAPQTDYLILEGERYFYIGYDGVLYRLDRHMSRPLKLLLTEINNAESGKLIFQAEQYEKLVTVVLPQLQNMNMIDEQTVFPAGISLSPPAVKIYLDTEKFKVTAKLLFCYGDIEINPAVEAGQTQSHGVFRNPPAEMRACKALERYGFAPVPQNGLFVLADEARIYNFYMTGVADLQARAQLYVTDAFRAQEIKPMAKASFGVRMQGDLLSLTIGETADYTITELLDAIKDYRLKKRYHRLKNGAFLSFDDEHLQEYAETLAALHVTKKDLANGEIRLPTYRALYVDAILGEGDAAKRDENFKTFVHNLTHFDALAIQPPASLQDIMRPYQVSGFKWLKTLAKYGFSGILADDMGLGKTLQVISVLLSEKESAASEGKKPKTIVITPTSLVYNWAYEIEKFAPQLQVAILSGTATKRRTCLHESVDADVLITSYDALWRDIENYKGMAFRFVVADEAQHIKNPLTKSAIALKRLDGKTRYALTGTPIENTLAELWSVFDFVLPGYLYTSGKFKKLYEAPIVKENCEQKAKLLQKQIAPFLLRRLKREVLKELPEKVETTLYAEMEGEQKKVYTATLMQARGELESHETNQIEILALLTRLRQICCHPGMFIENYKGGSAKLDLAMDTILSCISSGHRILLFSQFTTMLAILRQKLDEARVSYFYLDGATEARLRANMAEKFNSGEKNMFLISLKAGGTGLNLTGADVVMHYDQWWNPAVMNQAADRAHRYGQEKTLQVISLVTKNTIEEKILTLQEKKKNLVDSVLNVQEDLLGKITAEELRALFM